MAVLALISLVACGSSGASGASASTRASAIDAGASPSSAEDDEPFLSAGWATGGDHPASWQIDIRNNDCQLGQVDASHWELTEGCLSVTYTLVEAGFGSGGIVDEPSYQIHLRYLDGCGDEIAGCSVNLTDAAVSDGEGRHAPQQAGFTETNPLSAGDGSVPTVETGDLSAVFLVLSDPMGGAPAEAIAMDGSSAADFLAEYGA